MNNRRITLVRPSQVFDSFMDEFFNNTGLSTIMTGTVDVDMYETEGQIIVKFKAPGYKEDDVKISVENNILTVEGLMKKENKETQDKESRKYHIKEFKEESFLRTLTLPTRVNAEKAEATFENGVITVTLPKMDEVKPKTITIKPVKAK